MATISNPQQDTLDVQAHQVKAYNENGGVRLGPWTSHFFYSDPKHLAFSLSRYKFVSKIFNNYSSVLEVGCGDCFGSVIVADNVAKYYGIDFEEFVIEDNKDRLRLKTNMSFFAQDIIKSPFSEKVSSAFSLDVIEHIPEQDEGIFIQNIVSSIDNGPLLLGTPNITAKDHASEYSRISHINLKSAESLGELLTPFYKTVLSFSMNDEVVHTGFSEMAHYIFALGIDRRD
jgi:2-polyprenyl-3-methyl-5-hydroxy-6-metoxy-1,4-benzoquinol methylase